MSGVKHVNDPHLSKRFNSLAFFIGTPVIIASGVLYKTASRYYNSVLHRGKNNIMNLPIVSESQEKAVRADKYNTNSKWAETTPNSDHLLISHDGISLYAAAYTQNSDNWAIVVHGYTGHGMQMIEASKQF